MTEQKVVSTAKAAPPDDTGTDPGRPPQVGGRGARGRPGRRADPAGDLPELALAVLPHRGEPGRRRPPGVAGADHRRRSHVRDRLGSHRPLGGLHRRAGQHPDRRVHGDYEHEPGTGGRSRPAVRPGSRPGQRSPGGHLGHPFLRRHPRDARGGARTRTGDHARPDAQRAAARVPRPRAGIIGGCADPRMDRCGCRGRRAPGSDANSLRPQRLLRRVQRRGRHPVGHSECDGRRS